MSSNDCVKNISTSDWEKAWANEVGSKKRQKKWTKDTPKIFFEKMAVKDEYHEKLIPKLILNEKDTVLDLGSGEGAVTSLIAEKVKSVTALDSSPVMLDMLKQRIEHYNIDNIDIVEMDIEDATVDNVGEYDVIVASRSFMGIHEIKDTILNINKIAKKYVFLVVFGRNNWNLEKKFYKSIGKDYPDFAPYDYLFNLLISLGIYPNVENFDLIGNRKYDDIEDAFIRMKWKMGNLTEDEIDKIKPFLKENLTLNKEDGMLENPADKADIVLMWWKIK
ncbi:Ubiquinone/menaquinone biosynthesis C-methyltransferase UbiE [bioreactor metagenome]|uniref:Ubiquinone/menaquinone biosynthesis C-methyltransferase UbiE n=1 Tax=bioreactor metagenome TaxID=1076179 RepID=A0A644U9Q6_9ZZZZ|nr:methyltransferase domain-containing protein [Methanobrevibacter sp.]MEA4956656.1 methyltransferase domain-containing protein [Methanobrevibacter sp.]